MNTDGLKIISDFSDYYDSISSDEDGVVYKRNLCDCKQRGSALKYLRSIGIKTIEIKQVNNFSYLDDTLVVYTDPKKHSGKGKRIVSYGEAQGMGSNVMASKFYSESKGLTVKYLQIGKRRYTLYFQRDDIYSLEKGRLVKIEESSQTYNMLIGLPIFSIDYISNGSEMLATDFNEVQSLKDIYMDHYIDASTVKREVIEALMAYNKI